MKTAILLVAVLLSGCASPRVLVKDCQDVASGIKDCELIKKF
jgi:PBP1b-binding outer membrane lipoprotein LpoB